MAVAVLVQAVVHEYERLRTHVPRPRETIDYHSAAKHPENLEKNRYRDVLPYDKTRVRLAASGHDPSAQPTNLAQRDWAGYINARYVISNFQGLRKWKISCRRTVLLVLDQDIGSPRISSLCEDSLECP